MKHLFMTLALLVIALAPVEAQKKELLKVGTFNLRMDTKNDGENAWEHRKEQVKALIRFYDFDLLGTQEGFAHQLAGILELKDYQYIGAGREDGRAGGEHSAIFYRKDRFKVLDKGDFWLSETPDKPGLGWDATCCNRICSWGKFEDMKSKKIFYFFNVHYDHEGVEARRQSSHLIMARIKSIAGDTPVFLTGDFNAQPTDEPIQILSQGNLLKDSYTIAQEPPFGPVCTYHGYNSAIRTEDRIDYVWVTNGIQVNKYGVLTNTCYGRTPSDHFPILVVAEF